MTTLSTNNPDTNRKKIIWMLILFMVIEKVIENGALVPLILKTPFGDLTSNLLYKGIEIFLVLGLNSWLVKQKLFISFSLNVKTIIFIICGIGYISIFIPMGSLKLLLPMILLTLLTAISEELLYRGVIFANLLKIFTKRHSNMLNTISAVGLSSLLFSLEHLSNLMNQSWPVTYCQLIQTFGMGVLFAAVYLRTGSLFLTMLMHYIIDFPTLYLITISTSTNTQSNFVAQVSVIDSFVVAMIYIVIGMIVIHSKLKDNRLTRYTY